MTQLAELDLARKVGMAPTRFGGDVVRVSMDPSACRARCGFEGGVAGLRMTSFVIQGQADEVRMTHQSALST